MQCCLCAEGLKSWQTTAGSKPNVGDCFVIGERLVTTYSGLHVRSMQLPPAGNRIFQSYSLCELQEFILKEHKWGNNWIDLNCSSPYELTSLPPITKTITNKAWDMLYKLWPELIDASKYIQQSLILSSWLTRSPEYDIKHVLVLLWHAK